MDKKPVFSKRYSDTVPSRKEKITYFDECYAEFHQAVYVNIIKFVQDPVLAEDILQDVFLAFWENMDTLEAERIVNWLFVVSFNKSVNCLKKLRKYKNPGIAESIDVADEVGIDEEDFERKLQLIDQALDLLSDRKREIFRMYRMQGKSISEISSEMDLSVNTIKDHLKIAHRLVRTYLDQKNLNYCGIELLFALYLLT